MWILDGEQPESNKPDLGELEIFDDKINDSSDWKEKLATFYRRQRESVSKSNCLGVQGWLEMEMEVVHFVEEEDEGRLKNKEKVSDNNFHSTQNPTRFKNYISRPKFSKDKPNPHTPKT